MGINIPTTQVAGGALLDEYKRTQYYLMQFWEQGREVCINIPVGEVGKPRPREVRGKNGANIRIQELSAESGPTSAPAWNPLPA